MLWSVKPAALCDSCKVLWFSNGDKSDLSPTGQEKASHMKHFLQMHERLALGFRHTQEIKTVCQVRHELCRTTPEQMFPAVCGDSTAPCIAHITRVMLLQESLGL